MICPNCKEQIPDQLLICPICKESISEPVTFRKRSVLINKEAIQIYEELSQEEKKEHDYMKAYKKEIYQQARNINLKNEKKDDVLDIFGKEEKEKPCLIVELLLTMISGSLILLLFLNHTYTVAIPLGIRILYVVYAILGSSALVLTLALTQILRKRKLQTLLFFIILNIVFIASIGYLHWVAQII
jgi:RNA polymerase subunit RPABC4/transcription elongation factor Spt4